MTTQDLFNSVKQFNTVSAIKDWAASIGYDFNPDYTGLEDENDHPNYQDFFHLDVLFAEMRNLDIQSGDRSVVIIHNQSGNEILAANVNDDYYNDLIEKSEIHVVTAS